MEKPAPDDNDVLPGENDDPEPEEGDFYEELPLDDPAGNEGDDNDVAEELREERK